MASSPTQLPAFIQLRYEENGVFEKLAGGASTAAQRAEKNFSGAFKEIDRQITRVLSRDLNFTGALDLGVSEMRAAATAQELRAKAARELAIATSQAAQVEKDFSQSTRQALQGMRALAVEEDLAAKAARSHAQALEQVQTQLNFRQAGGTNRPSADARDGVTRLVSGDASIDRAAISATTLDQVLGRVADKGRFVQQALDGVRVSTEQAAAAAEKLDGQALARAAEEAQKYALAAAQLRSELDPMFQAQQQFDRELVRADQLLEAGTISTREYAQAQQLARDNLRQASAAVQGNVVALGRGTLANSQMVNSTRALRQATLQAGQQLQDIGISLVSGQRAGIVFAQQLPQLAFALSGLEGQANKTQAAIGRFARFLAGPWGLVVGIAVGVLGTLIASFFDTGDAAEKAESKTFDFSLGLDVLTLSAKDSAAAMAQLTQELRGAIAVQGDFLRSSALVAGSSVSALEGRIASSASELAQLERARTSVLSNLLPTIAGPSTKDRARESELRTQLAADRAALAEARRGVAEAAISVGQQNVIESRDPAAKARGDFNRAVGELNNRRKQTVANSSDPLFAVNNPDIAISQKQFEAEFGRLSALKEAAEDAAKAANKKDKPDRPKRDTSADKAARETERLADFGNRAAESIQRINERFNEQPRLIDQANQATRALDDTIKELAERKPPGFEELIEQAGDAKLVIGEALQRPYEDLIEASERRLQFEELIATGYVDEAQALQEVWQLEKNIGDVSDERRAIILDTIQYERERSRELDRQRELLDAQVNVLDTARDGLKDILSGRKTDLFGDLKQSIDDLRGARAFDDIFGNVFKQLEDELSKNSPLGKASKALADEVTKTSTSAKTLGTEFINLAQITAAAAASISNATTFDEAFADITGAANDNAGGIVVNGEKPKETEIARLSISQIADKTAHAFLAPLLDGLKDILGTGFTQSLGTVLEGALSGFIQGGKVGGVIGGAKGLSEELFGKESKIAESLGDALSGAQTGSRVAGIGNALGIGLSNSGAQIGGAIGGLTGIPGGDVIGAIAGGVIGKLIKKTAGAVIRGPGDVTLGGADRGGFDRAEGLAGSVLDGLQNIADKFDASIGNFFTTIGTRGGEIKVNANGNSLKGKNGAIGFGDDEAAAIAFALADAIKDGALLGLRASTLRLLQAGSDIEKQLAKAVSFEDVFKRLRNIKDPVGAAIDSLNKEFTRLNTIFKEAGASVEEFAQLEELYGFERAQAVKEAGERISGSLRSLFDELTIGDSGLSLRTRRENAVDKFQPLAERVAAGDVTAFDDFADASRTLLDIERQIFGSQEDYFNRLTEITNLTKTRIDEIDNATSIAAGSDSPFDSSGAVRDSIDTQTGELTNRLDAINQNLIRLGGGGILPSAPPISSTFDFNQIRQVINF